MGSDDITVMHEQSVTSRGSLRGNWLLGAAIVFLVVTFAMNVWSWYGPPSWRPRIACRHAEFDFGDMPVGQAIAHEFVLENTGKEELVISDVAADCGCLAVQLEETVIPPRYSLVLPVNVSLRNQSKGALRKHVIVKSNDPVVPSLLLTISGTVSTE
jgi:hypothetical protein